MSIVRKIADLPRAAVVAAGDQFTIWRNGRTYQADLSLILTYIGLVAKGDKGDKGEQGIQGPQGIPGQKGDKGDTTANFDVTPLTATGTPTGRLLPNRAADYTNVKDYGAKLDGTDDTSAFQAARAAAGQNGIVRVPAGQFVAGLSPDRSKTVLWQLSGNAFGSSTVPVYQIGADIVETFLPGNGGKYISRGATTDKSLPMFTTRQDVSHSGGSGGVLTTNQSVTSHNLGSNPNAFIWNALDIFYDHSIIPGGNNVARYSQYNREAAPAYSPSSDPGPHNNLTGSATSEEAIPYGAPINLWAIDGVLYARKASNLFANSPTGSSVPFPQRRLLTAQGFAISLATASGQSISFVRDGLLGGSPGLVAGTDYYLGDVPGTFTSIAPTTSQTDRFVQHIGTGVQATVNGQPAVYLDIRLTGKTPGWGMVSETRDKTGRPSSQTGPMIGNETDVFGNNFDDANLRYGVDVVVGRHDAGPGSFMEAAAAYRASSSFVNGASEADSSWFKRGVLVDSGISIAAFDASLATYRGPNVPVAFRAGVGNRVDLSNDASRTIRYAGGKLAYALPDTSLFEVSDNGDARVFGALTTVGFIQQDQQAPASPSDPIGVIGEVRYNNQYYYRKTTSGWLRFTGTTTWTA